MTNFNKLSIINTVLLLAIIVVLVIGYFKKDNVERIVYIDNQKVFNEFNMTKDLKAIGMSKIKAQTKELDSLYSKFKSLPSELLKEASAKSLQQQIAYKSKALHELQDNYTQNLSQKVWSRLNSYVADYAKFNNLKIILGTNGSGNVMYAEDSIDISNKIIKFSNKKYEGN